MIYFNHIKKIRLKFFHLRDQLLQLPPNLLCNAKDAVAVLEDDGPAAGALLVHPGEALGTDKMLFGTPMNWRSSYFITNRTF